MKKGVIVSTITGIVLIILFCFIIINPFTAKEFSENKPEFYFRTNGNKIQHYEDGNWTDFEIKGVNMGNGYPGTFPNDKSITEETYERWFQEIGEMNANTVRVYQLQSPEFYAALSKYNEEHDKKVYLIQTVDFPERMMYSEESLFDSDAEEELFTSARNTVDALHGDRISFDQEKLAMNFYTYDVSDYVLGYILGIEWDDTFVEYVSVTNKERHHYEGAYVKTSNQASAFETFLSEWGDEIVEYEGEKYHMQHLLSFGNWAETDPFVNEIKVENRRDLEVLVDIQHILPSEKMKTGIFASYNIYPYYPLFLQYGPYTKYIDDEGNANPYRKYLMELVEYHSYPVVISEYGTPSSRSVAHEDLWRDIPHGGLNEEEQANAIVTLYTDIKKAGCAGSMVFSWQDEWYKRAWNEMTLSDADGRSSWSNVQSSEQFFGLLSFDPGKEKDAVYPDGNIKEWTKDDQIIKKGSTTVSMKQDEKYLHIMVEGLSEQENQDYISLALDITPKLGKTSVGELTFDHPMDFIIRIGKDGNSALYIDEDYDMLAYSIFGVFYDNSVGGLEELTESMEGHATKLPYSGQFSIVARADNGTYGMMATETEINEVGILKEGNGNPKSASFDSNADYCLGENLVEIRIPWQLLNFTDPSRAMVIDDLEENDMSICNLQIEDIHVAPYFENETGKIKSGTYEMHTWSEPVWHERLKESYYMLQKAFEE